MSTASSTPAGGWYADPLDASLLRWWDGATWSQQTMPADPALSPSNAAPKSPLAAVPPLLTAVPPLDEPYVPPNSVFRMAETTAADAYVPEWSGLTDISDEVALSGVPVQLALTATPSEPPIPVSADVFPTLRAEASTTTPPIKDPVWKVEAPLAAPVDQLFPVAAAAPATAVEQLFPPAPAPAPAPAPPAPPAMAPFAALGTPISPPEPAASTLSPELFPVAAAPAAAIAHVSLAAAAPTGPSVVPQPVGDAFPGLVPIPAPMEQAMPLAQPMSQAAPMPQAAPAAVLYAGPPPTMLGADPVAPPDFQPFAASTPEATYVPLTPRPIPQPLQLGAPAAALSAPADQSQLVVAEAAPVAFSAPTAAAPAPAPAPAAAVEYWPTQGAPTPGVQYQPNPGDYVPFDPNSVHLEPVPVIPFSSRDPYNSASTARPGMRAYGAAPVGPTGSTWTGGLAFMLLAPLISAAVFFVWSQLTTTVGLSLESVSWLPIALGAVGLMGLAAAQIDRNTLARRGYFDLASPFWVLLIPPLIYLIVRATRLRGQGRGAAPAIGLWALSYVAGNALVGVIALMWLSAPTPERVTQIETSIEHQLATQKVTATVTCPAVTSLAPGSSFECTMLTQGASLPIRVTISDWQGDFTATPLSPGTT